MKANKKIYLRALEPEDHLISTVWRNDIEVTKSLGGNYYFVSLEREKKWIEDVIRDDQKHTRLAICISGSKKYIGNVNLTNINWINRNAEFSILIGDKNEWGKGYGYAASIQMLEYGFKQLNLQRIYLSLLSNNLVAKKLYTKIGFKKEGILRNTIFKDNAYQDVIIMAILKEEYLK